MKKIILICFTTLLLCCFAACDNKGVVVNENEYLNINLSEHITIEYSEELCDLVIDVNYEQINSMIGDKDKMLFESFTREFGDLSDAITASIQMPENADNGDVATVSWTVNPTYAETIKTRLYVNFIYDDFEYTIQNLPDIVDVNPFDYLICDSQGSFDGNGNAKFYSIIMARGVSILYEVEHNGTNGSLQNGDNLHLQLKNSEECIEYAKKYRLQLTATETDIELHQLATVVNNDAIFPILYDDQKEAFDSVANEWIVGGLNDLSFNASMRTFERIGFIYYAPKKDNTDGMLVAIYKVQDPFLQPYYAFVGLEGLFTTNHNSIQYNWKSEFPSSFAYYEKEKTRYSDEYGWAENTEETSFYGDDRYYAGKQTLNETLEYLNKEYGIKYGEIYFSFDTQQYLQ